MHVQKNDFRINLGKGVGNELEELLLKAKKKIWIVSPWISKKYAELLLKKKEDDVDVKLITTTSYQNRSHLEGLKTLIKPKTVKDEKDYKLYTWLMLASIPFVALFGAGIVGFVPGQDLADALRDFHFEVSVFRAVFVRSGFRAARPGRGSIVRCK